jgi:hypothetical protein
MGIPEPRPCMPFYAHPYYNTHDARRKESCNVVTPKAKTRSKHGSKSAIRGNGLPRTRLSSFVGRWLAVPKRESNEQALAHRIFPVGHTLQRSLLVMNLLILSHISFVAEVIKVSSVRLRVELWHERRTLSSNCSPVNLSKVLMGINFLDV